MNLTKHYSLDQEKLKGVWVDIPEGGRVKLCRSECFDFRTAQAQAAIKFKEETGRPTSEATEQEIQDITARVYADVVVKDWEGVIDFNEEGEEVSIEFSKEKCFEILRNPEFEPFFDFIVSHAGRMSYFRKDYVEKTEKNLSDTSTTS